MPGPRNQRKKKAQKKKAEVRQSLDNDSTSTLPESQPTISPSDTVSHEGTDPIDPSVSIASSKQQLCEAPAAQPSERDFYPLAPEDQLAQPIPSTHYTVYPPEQHDESPIPPSLLKTPFIHDPGDGLRVKDTRAFLASSFAAPPSLDDQLCAEFADEAVVQMLCTVLPEETAMILWYNKSRRNSRICPACHRLYRLGDVLPDHLVDEETREQSESRGSPLRAREQELSGLCSPICFILAAYNYPGAIRSTWGRMAEELDDATWDLLDGPGQHANDMGLGMLVKMTRCHDLGLGQLFFPDMEFDSDATCNEPDSEKEEDEKGYKWLEVQERPSAADGEEDITVEMEKVALNDGSGQESAVGD